ncbi:MAG: hypothetical protein IJM74_00220, partial [Bacteroidales bacterium]|nr:hypothetical protein [Bacteroidales bacterium]
LVPMLLFLPGFFVEHGGDGVNGVWWAMPISDFISSFLAGTLLYYQLRRFDHLMEISKSLHTVSCPDSWDENKKNNG